MDAMKRDLADLCGHGPFEDSHLGRRTFLKRMGFACCGLASFAIAHRVTTGNKSTEAIAEEKAMGTTQVTKVSIPPIDASRPVSTETASFALG
jgi:hypothetical protein